MAAILIEQPQAEPLTLAEAKAFLRVEHSADDELITSLVRAARLAVEAATRRAMLTQGWRIVLDGWPSSGLIVAPITPLRAIVAAQVRNAAGDAVALDLAALTLDAASAPGRIRFDRARVGAPGQLIAGIEIEVTVGYGDDGEAVPEPLRQAMRLLVGRYYEQRDRVEGDSLPEAVAALLAPYRVVSL